MIYFSSTPLKTWQPNLIMLDLEDDMGHIYVTRNTYDQAVLIADRFDHSSDLVMDKLAISVTQEDVTSFMIAILPAPINILTPFFNLIDESVKLDVDNLKQVIGVLSYISMNLDLNRMLKIPFEVRANLVYTKSILMEYQGHFEDFNFRISSNNGHIVNDRYESGGGGRSIRRADQEDFELEDEKRDNDEFDAEAFFADLNWDAIPIPTIDTTPSTTDPVESTTTQDPYAAVADIVTESQECENIALRFVL